MVKEIVNFRVWSRKEGEKTKLSSIEEVVDFLESNSLIECDTETTGFCPHQDNLLCIQFGKPEVQYLIEWDKSVFKYLDRFFRDSSKTFIFHYAAFDLKVLYKQGFLVSNVFDTFLAESVLTMGIRFHRRDLKSLLWEYLGYNMSKAIRQDIPRLGLIPETIEYGLDDVKFLTRLREKQLVKIKELELERALSLENNFVKVLAYMEYIGMGFDREKWLKQAKINQLARKELIIKMNSYIVKNKLKKYYNYAGLFDEFLVHVDGVDYGVSIKWTSPKQVTELFKDLGFDVSIVEKGEEKESIGKEFLQKHEKDHELIGYFSEFIKINKLVSSFGEDYLKFINPVTKRIHSSFKQLVNTGRMSSGDKSENKPNLQQLPAEAAYRSCFIPAEGNVLIAADYSGMESVVFANKTLDEGLLYFYDSGQEDMHSFVASKCFPQQLYGMSLEQIKTMRPDLRNDAKGAGFAIQFGGDGSTISRNLGLDPKVGEDVYNSYMEGFPGVKDYFTKVIKETKDNGYILFNDLTKRKSFFDFKDRYDDLKKQMDSINWAEYRREKSLQSEKFIYDLQPIVKEFFFLDGIMSRRALNYPVQGSSADITKTALLLLWNWIIEEDLYGVVHICNVVHDEILVECPKDMAEEVSMKVQWSMERAGEIFFQRVPLKAEPVIGDCWIH